MWMTSSLFFPVVLVCFSLHAGSRAVSLLIPSSWDWGQRLTLGGGGGSLQNRGEKPFFPFSTLGAPAGPLRSDGTFKGRAFEDTLSRGLKDPYTTLDKLTKKRGGKAPLKKLVGGLGGLTPEEVFYADKDIIIVKGGGFREAPQYEDFLPAPQREGIFVPISLLGAAPQRVAEEYNGNIPSIVPPSGAASHFAPLALFFPSSPSRRFQTRVRGNPAQLTHPTLLGGTQRNVYFLYLPPKGRNPQKGGSLRRDPQTRVESQDKSKPQSQQRGVRPQKETPQQSGVRPQNETPQTVVKPGLGVTQVQTGVTPQEGGVRPQIQVRPQAEVDTGLLITPQVQNQVTLQEGGVQPLKEVRPQTFINPGVRVTPQVQSQVIPQLGSRPQQPQPGINQSTPPKEAPKPQFQGEIGVPMITNPQGEPQRTSPPQQEIPRLSAALIKPVQPSQNLISSGGEPPITSEEVVSAGHSLADDTKVNTLFPRPPINPDAEMVPLSGPPSAFQPVRGRPRGPK